jgi:hypothetical protein
MVMIQQQTGERKRQATGFLLAALVSLFGWTAPAAAAEPAVKHPNLLLNREEIEP